ncbi:MAG TPA: murein biosynthesis integral membrane protein MurJ, partial [bacterium]|nr:murein biosynthesis integral membrane protein MurJ [bacterium]
MSFRSITRAAAVIALTTALARLLGLFREVVSARAFGTTGVYDAFLLAFMIPNFFRGLLAEGALSTAFVPVYTEILTDPQRKEERAQVVAISFTFSLVLTCSLYLLVLITVPLVQRFLHPVSRWFLTFSLLRFTFPYLIFISLSALEMGVLNCHKHFFLPAASPILLDLVWMAAILWLCPLLGGSLERQILGLCVAVTAGGAAQFLLQLPAVRRRGVSFRFNFNFRHPALLKMRRLLAPVIIGVAVGPINLLVDYSLANFLSGGMVSALWYATRLYQLPLGIFAISLSTAVLPWLAERRAQKNLMALRRELTGSLSLVCAVLLPCTIGLFLFRKEIVALLFQRGMFSASSVEITAFALGFYSLGLVGYGAASVLTRGFYAFQDTRTPVLVGVISIATNFFLDIILMGPLQHGGIA